MLDAQETLEHGGSRRCDPHPEIVVERHSGPADVPCQVESKAEDKVAAVTFYGRFPSSRRRAARRPFRPPWRNRFSLGRSSFGGRSFFFMAEIRRGTGRGLRKPPHVGCLVPAGSLIKDDGVSLSLRESQVASNARDAGRFGLSGDVRRVRMSLRIRFGRTLWTGLHGLSERWPCRRCRPSLVVWMQGLHDAVNVRLGKRPLRPEAFARFSAGALNGSYHFGCFGCRVARWGSRLVARTSSPTRGPA